MIIRVFTKDGNTEEVHAERVTWWLDRHGRARLRAYDGPPGLAGTHAYEVGLEDVIDIIEEV